MLTTSRLDKIDELVQRLSSESDEWLSLAIGIDLANEIMLGILPDNPEWESQLNLDVTNTGRLPMPLPRDTFKNQKQVVWFREHPESKSARSAFRNFYSEDAAVESKFFWFSESATKQKISAATEYSPNWEDSELTRKPNYKVGIDFFLTSDTNTLLLVLSNHQKLRVLELHGRLSNTQKQIFKNNLNGAASFDGIVDGVQQEFEPQRTIHTSLWNALQLKEVNNKFYRIVADHFQELVDSIRNQGKTAEDAQQFSSRLLGRLLFIWFLRKMDIIDETQQYFETASLSADDYYDSKVKTLFFRTLNTEIEDRQHSDSVTPYLNGGLFEPKENDFVNDRLEFPKNFFDRLYGHFDEFNFTTDESSADFELIAVDPEMLGQVFESLLASQLDDEGTNERSKTGAFYTPREIVGYMVKETLRQYLYGKIDKVFHSGVDELLDLSDSQWLARKSTSSADVWGVNTKLVTQQVKEALDTFKVLDPAVGSGAFPMGMLQLLLKTYERIEKRFDPYKLKLSIIENSIFGVDIQPMAVEIARLRAWLSVIVDEQDKKNIQPLPNLEFKFISANSLVELEKGQTDLFVDARLDEQLSDLRMKYFNARKPAKKHDIQKSYYEMTQKVSLFEDERSVQLKTFDPFKNRKSASFFDSEYMFGVEKFDAVIGNPPYIHFEKLPKELRDFYAKYGKKYYETYAARGDMYALFYEKGVNLLREGGILAYITSNKWMRSGYGASLRDFFVNKTNPKVLVDLGGGVFESATVDTNILVTEKSNNVEELKAITFDSDGLDNMSVYIRQNAVSIVFKTGEPWTILSQIEQSIKSKIERYGTPLKEWNIDIQYGVKTGLNEAFIIPLNVKNKLISEDPKSAEIIRPILRGRDIFRDEIHFENIFLINTHNGYTDSEGNIVPRIDIDDYPAIKNWLDNGSWNSSPSKGNNYERLKKRTDQGDTPYNLRSLAYMDDFNSTKILWSDISIKPNFALVDSEYLINNTAYMITGAMKNTVRLLNSAVTEWYLPRIATDLGKGIRYFKQFVEQVPIPDLRVNPRLDEAINSMEQDINQVLFDFYKFTDEEIAELLK